LEGIDAIYKQPYANEMRVSLACGCISHTFSVIVWIQRKRLEARIKKNRKEARNMKNRAVMPQTRFEVQQYHGKVNVVRQNGVLPRPQAEQVLVRMTACGICGTDIRAVAGNKLSSGSPHEHITLGHEGVGHVITVGSKVTNFKKGDCVVVLPHVYSSSGKDIYTSDKNARINPVSIGHHDTQHMGWDIDGCFADSIIVPAENLVRVNPSHLHMAKKLAPELGEAMFALVEPMLCTLTAYTLIEEHLRKLGRRRLTAGRALVIGCGPIGMLHALILLKRGFEVWLMDSLTKRATLGQWLLNNDQVHVFNPAQHTGKFHLVMVAASSAEAITTGERLVRNKGILYLFAGLNTAERETRDQERVLSYEQLHRNAKGMLTTIRQAATKTTIEEKSILYLGHSGYYQAHAEQAIEEVATNADTLERMVTGVIRGWTSSCIETRFPVGNDWTTEDGSPAILSVLNGANLHNNHCKLLVLTDCVS
jgi:threonine dehydrogenase-like Zn-dependent dehydrogenase